MVSTCARVVTLGESLGLVRSVTTGSFAVESEARLSFGGAESNVAIGLARLGTPVSWFGRVGADAFGTRIIRTLRGEGVEVHATIDDSAPTAVMLKEQPTLLRSRVTYHRRGSAGSRLCPEDLDDAVISAASVLHVTGITAGLSSSALAAIDHAIAVAQAGGALVSFDVNHRSTLWGDDDPRPVYRALARRADILFAGPDEAELLLDEPVSLPALAALGPKEVVLKQGADGCAASDSIHQHVLPSRRVPVVDSVGAGDAFVAGYLADRVAGKSFGDRLATAVANGALACTVAGDWEAAPTRADLALLDAAEPVVR